MALKTSATNWAISTPCKPITLGKIKIAGIK